MAGECLFPTPTPPEIRDVGLRRLVSRLAKLRMPMAVMQIRKMRMFVGDRRVLVPMQYLDVGSVAIPRPRR